MYINEYGNTNDPNVKPVIRKGYPHCGYMAAHTKEYVEELEIALGHRGAS